MVYRRLSKVVCVSAGWLPFSKHRALLRWSFKVISEIRDENLMNKAWLRFERPVRLLLCACLRPVLKPALYQVKGEELQEKITRSFRHVPPEHPFIILIDVGIEFGALIGERLHFLPVASVELRVIVVPCVYRFRVRADTIDQRLRITPPALSLLSYDVYLSASARVRDPLACTCAKILLESVTPTTSHL
jgi:hypothetical protein